MIGLFKMMRNKRLFILLIGLILFIAVMGFSLSDRKDLTWPEKFLNDTVGYVQQWFYKPAGYIAGLFEDIRSMRELHEENERLRMTVASYARDKIRYNALEQKNAELQEKLNFTEEQKNRNNYTYMIAQVVSVSPDAYNKTMKINLGSRHGVKENMAVVTEHGLIGLISSVSPFTSNVMPITELDGQSANAKWISATVEGNEEASFGIIESYNIENGQLLMTKIAEEDPLKEGDVVVTSGKGEVFPVGIVIGTVTSEQVGDFGLTRTAFIDPAAQFDKLSEVLVVKVPDAEGDAE
ncbi:rod shape-determining protein MreC [Paenibacillus daejeonensis]|uniref:rod shape-determining protein MreC n=1 Tax=Paenibacillus daejeonensis TaxID=135193 RepID=UPI00037C710A|nr:rod shape-determining protein MreC [Paenibacillus daejeonensis]